MVEVCGPLIGEYPWVAPILQSMLAAVLLLVLQVVHKAYLSEYRKARF
jgi:chromate transport protein ChrA